MPIDKSKVQSALQAKGALRPCESCGAVSFGLADELVCLPIWIGGNVMMGQTVPAVLLSCNSCGCFRLFPASAVNAL